jgi:hypothetical protein
VFRQLNLSLIKKITMPIQQSLQRLEYLSITLAPLLRQLDETQYSFKVSELKWSKKEILGHLIDSAANNHQRFIRTQFEEEPFIKYDQNNWNHFNFYQHASGESLISLWQSYNLHLAHLIKHIPEKNLALLCRVSEDKSLSLEFLINDYVVHQEHHLKQIVNYK